MLSRLSAPSVRRSAVPGRSNTPNGHSMWRRASDMPTSTGIPSKKYHLSAASPDADSTGLRETPPRQQSSCWEPISDGKSTSYVSTPSPISSQYCHIMRAVQELLKNYVPPPVDLSTPYKFEFVAPPPAPPSAPEPGVITDPEEMLAAWLTARAVWEKKQGGNVAIEEEEDVTLETSERGDANATETGDTVMSDKPGANVPHWKTTGEVLDSEPELFTESELGLSIVMSESEEGEVADVTGAEDVEMSDALGANVQYWEVTGEVLDSEPELFTESELGDLGIPEEEETDTLGAAVPDSEVQDEE
ncbi:hypothetical protein QBC39DRAFT_385854, partial [Podospora conica]